jgi:hypothetical protein
MTFQPPPPPPGGNEPPPPPPPPGQWGPPPGGGYPAPRGGFDPKAVNPLDWGILGAGVLAFIFSLFDYYTVDISIAGFGSGSDSASAWHGFFGWFATLLAIAGAAVVAMDLFAPHVKLPWPNRLVALALFALATLSTIIALFTNAYDDHGLSGIDTGHGFGYWASLVVIVAGLVLSLMRLQQTGGTLPGPFNNLPNIGARGPQGGIGGGQPTPPPGQGYAPPPPGQFNPPPPGQYNPPPGQ